MDPNNKDGKLYLIPTPLMSGEVKPIPAYNCQVVAGCQHFIVESLKMGRRHIRAMVRDKDLDACIFLELSKKTPPETYGLYLNAAKAGHDICLLSDAGSPTIADPGAPMVGLAHRMGIIVIPLSGPSAIMLALMGSGFSGQHFTFRGYLSPQKNQVRSDLRQLENLAEKGVTQIFMETPYRNMALFQQALDSLKPHTLLCIACDITAPTEQIETQSIKEWKQRPLPDLHKRPCIFVVGRW